MRFGRPVTAANPALFGRRGVVADRPHQALLTSDDARLFLGTFAAGFAFTMMLFA